MKTFHKNKEEKLVKKIQLNIFQSDNCKINLDGALLGNKQTVQQNEQV